MTEPGRALDARACRAQENECLAPPTRLPGCGHGAHRVRVEPLGISSPILQPQLPHLQIGSQNMCPSLHSAGTHSGHAVCEMLVLLGCQKCPAITHHHYYYLGKWGSLWAAWPLPPVGKAQGVSRVTPGGENQNRKLDTPTWKRRRGVKRAAEGSESEPTFNEMFTMCQP